MNKMLAIFAAVSIGELFLLQYTGTAPLYRPGWYETAQSVLVLLTCWGGAESARWILRSSYASRISGPKSDWTKLWLWLGVPGGILFLAGLLLSWFASDSVSIPTSDYILGHFAPGAFVWMVAGGVALYDIFGNNMQRGLTGTLAIAGYAVHILGALVFFYVYPALLVGPWKHDLLLFLVLFRTYQFFFYYVLGAGVILWFMQLLAIKHNLIRLPESDTQK